MCPLLLLFLFLPRTVVGLDARVYTVSESDRAVEICVTASTGNAQRCPYVHPFKVNLATTGKTACMNTVEPLNNRHVGDEHFLHCSEVVPSSEVEMYMYTGRGKTVCPL